MGKYLWPEGAYYVTRRFLAPLEDGKELSEVMEEFVQRKDIRSHEGAIGIFTDDYVDRTELFVHVVKLLVGQYKYDKKQA